ncbi:unnamed protein product [Gordionus sp. m RMFG-2023]
MASASSQLLLFIVVELSNTITTDNSLINKLQQNDGAYVSLNSFIEKENNEKLENYGNINHKRYKRQRSGRGGGGRGGGGRGGGRRGGGGRGGGRRGGRRAFKICIMIIDNTNLGIGLKEEECSEWSLNTPIHIAVNDNDILKLDNLLKDERYKHLINCQNRFGCTPVMLAVKDNLFKICEKLLNHGANSDIADIKGQTCLMVATYNNQAHINNLSSPIYISSMMGMTAITCILLKYGANPNLCRVNLGLISTPLGIAISKCHVEIVKILLNHRADLTFVAPSHLIKKSVILKPINSEELLNTSRLTTNSSNTQSSASKPIISRQNYCYLALSMYQNYPCLNLNESAIYGDSDGSIGVHIKRRDILEILLACGTKPYLIYNKDCIENAKEETPLVSSTIMNHQKLHMASFWGGFVSKIKSQSSSRKTDSKQEKYLYCNMEDSQNGKVNKVGDMTDVEEIHYADNLAHLLNITNLPLPLTWLTRIVIRNCCLKNGKSLEESIIFDKDILLLPQYIQDFILIKQFHKVTRLYLCSFRASARFISQIYNRIMNSEVIIQSRNPVKI